MICPVPEWLTAQTEIGRIYWAMGTRLNKEAGDENQAEKKEWRDN